MKRLWVCQAVGSSVSAQDAFGGDDTTNNNNKTHERASEEGIFIFIFSEGVPQALVTARPSTRRALHNMVSKFPSFVISRRKIQVQRSRKMFRGGLRGIRLLSTSPSPPSPPMFTDNLGNPSPFKKVVPRAQRPPSSPSVRPAMNRSDKRPTYQGHPSPPARGQFKTGILSSESRQESSPPLGRKDDTGFKRRGRVDREQRSSNTQNSTKRRETDPTASTTRTHVKKEIVDDPRVYLQPGTTLATLSNLLRVPFGNFKLYASCKIAYS